MKETIQNQTGPVIITLNPNRNVQACIYNAEQRQAVIELIQNGFLPHHTSVGAGKVTNKHWSVEPYQGRFGKGYRMLTTSPYSRNFNHITYFTTA